MTLNVGGKLRQLLSTRGVTRGSRLFRTERGFSFCGGLAAVLLSVSVTRMAGAQASQNVADKQPEGPAEGAQSESEGPSSVSLGARGFGGVVAEGGEAKPVFGGGFLVGVPVYGRFEAEGSVMLASPKEEQPFVVTEIIAKWVPEVEGPVSPHIVLGPLLSIDFTSPIAVSAGAVVGVGATWWTNPRFGLITDLSYRLLLGSEVGHVGVLAFGVVFRPF